MDHAELRPVERRMLRLDEAGVAVAEIGERFRRSPQHMERVLELARLPGRFATSGGGGLRPIERRILGWLDQGASPEEIGRRFRRSAEFVSRVEGLARHKLAG